MTFWDHIDELRKVIMHCLIVIGVFAALAFVFKDELFAIVFAPKSSDFLPDFLGESPDIRIINTELTRQFTTHMMTSFYAGIIVAAPYIIYQLYKFVSPALYDNERHYATRIVTSGYLMFMVGTLFAYFVVFPFTLRFLADYKVADDVDNLISLESYIDTFAMLCLIMGIIFELPMLSWILGKMGLISKQLLSKYRRHAIVVIVVIAAIITPTTDAITLGLVSLPMYILFELSMFALPNNKSSHQ